MHIECLSACGKLVLTALESKKIAGGATEQDITDGLQRLAAFMMSTIALSQWGLGLKPGIEPIVGLLVYPSAIYRLSIWKPSDGDAVPFGLEHRIERTSDPLMMGWVLERFLRDYEADYHRLQGVDLKPGNPHPILWSALNYDLEEGLTPLRVTAPTNLGFLFRTDARNLRRLLEMHGRNIVVEDLFCDEIPDGEELIVKYLSALLVTPPRAYTESIRVLVEATVEFNKKRSLLIKVHEARLQEFHEINLSFADLRADCACAADIVNNKEEIEDSSETIQLITTLSKKILAEQSEIQIRMAEESAEISQLRLSAHIKHPYIGVVDLWMPGSYDHQHHLLVMRDMGTSLEDAMKDAAFLRRWRSSPELRHRFAVEVGESALNLTEMTWPGHELCHNDIKASNIAVKDGASFCLIDFDLAARAVQNEAHRCPVLLGLRSQRDRNKMFSIAQIALVVFALDVDAPRGAVRRLWRYWLRDVSWLRLADEPRPSEPAIPEFDAWLAGKGQAVADVFWYRPSAGRDTRRHNGIKELDKELDRAHFAAILDAMLA